MFFSKVDLLVLKPVFGFISDSNFLKIIPTGKICRFLIRHYHKKITMGFVKWEKIPDDEKPVIKAEFEKCGAKT